MRENKTVHISEVVNKVLNDVKLQQKQARNIGRFNEKKKNDVTYTNSF